MNQKLPERHVLVTRLDGARVITANDRDYFDPRDPLAWKRAVDTNSHAVMISRYRSGRCAVKGMISCRSTMTFSVAIDSDEFRWRGRNEENRGSIWERTT